MKLSTLKRPDETPRLLAVKTREAEHSDNFLLPLTDVCRFWKEYETSGSALASPGAIYITTPSQSQQRGLAGLSRYDGPTPTSCAALPHLLTKGTSEERCEWSLVGLSFLDCVIYISYSLFYTLMNSHQRYVPFIITQLDLCISLFIGFTAGALYHLECLHAAVSCLLIGSNN